MPSANYHIGEQFPVQFAWKLPEGDYIRAVFQAEVLDLVPAADKYIVRLNKLVAGRQETGEGERRAPESFSRQYWVLVGRIVGKTITLAYEADDSRALHLRLSTLTGEHNYFTRFEGAEGIARKRRGSAENASP
jgi:hypothetical protein